MSGGGRVESRRIRDDVTALTEEVVALTDPSDAAASIRMQAAVELATARTGAPRSGDRPEQGR